MKILAIVSGEYGLRHVANLRAHGPQSWSIETWRTPPAFPLVIDDPEDFLPATLPASDLILSFAQDKAVAELLPEIAKMTGARAVVVAVDSESWLPRGLARQLRGWLEQMNVACATPKPLCSLTERDYKITRRQRETYDSPLIAEFARYFGQPDLQLSVDKQRGIITGVEVRRDAVCGCARFVAEKLVGLPIDAVEEKAGLAHHHYPCLASMVKLTDYNYDTLMHESGHLLQDNLSQQLKPYRQTSYITPGVRSDLGHQE